MWKRGGRERGGGFFSKKEKCTAEWGNAVLGGRGEKKEKTSLKFSGK